MRAAELQEDQGFSIVDRPESELSPSDVRVRVSYCGVCGSDLHFRSIPEIFPPGSVLGHEASGTVTEVGRAVDRVSVGDRVTMNPFNPCGECARCLAGLETRCTKAASDGMGLGGRAGAYAETVTVSESMCIQLPNELDDRRAALSEPVAVGVHAVARAEVTVGEPVVVIGAGPIGVVTAMALRAQGFADVHVIERAFDRRSRVESMGFSASEGEEGYEGDAVAAAFECAGVPETATLAAAMVRPMGRVVLVGMATRPLVFDGIQLVLNETEIRASSAYTRDDFAQAVELLASDAVPGEELISRVADLAEINQVFTDLDGPTTDLKVLLKP